MAVIDLSTVPAPDIVETVSFDVVFAAMKADLVTLLPDIAPTLAQETSIAARILRVCAYREIVLRQRVNDAARALLIATATGADLEALAANFGVARLVVTAATSTAAAVMEDDDRLRRRILLAQEAYSVAGPAGAYIFHALTAVPSLRDASAISPEPGRVTVTLMRSASDPAPTSDHLTTVALALSDTAVRPLTDMVSVVAPNIIDVAIVAALTIYPGPDGAVVAANARTSLDAFLLTNAFLGRDLRRAALFSRLHVDGVQSVALASPAADVVIGMRDAVRITSITITVAGVDE